MRLILRTLLIVTAALALSAAVYGTGGGNHKDGNHKGKEDDMDVCDDHRDTVSVQRSEAAKRFGRNDDDDKKRNDDDDKKDDRKKHHEPGECAESPDR